MIKSYIKIAFRNFGRHNVFFLINVVGLAIGIASSLLILLWVEDELSYDEFHTNADSIYRLAFTGKFGNNELNTVNTAAPTAGILKNEYDEIIDATRLLKGWSKQVSYKEKSFSEDKFLFADNNFFEIFTFPLIIGDPLTVLQDTNTVVLTESTAVKYFGKEDPIGKILNSDSGRDFVVTGICKDISANSHINFDFIGSMETLEWSENQNWLTLSFLTYFVLNPKYDVSVINELLPQVSDKYIIPQLEEFLSIDMNDFAASGQTFKFEIQSLTDIHLYSNFDGELKQGGDKVYVLLFSIIAIFILIIACINFTNLTTARTVNRTKEIGVRKVLGSSRKQLIIQFLTESINLSLFALVFALALVEIMVPAFNNLTGKDMNFSVFGRWETLLFLAGLTFLVGLLAGVYPAILLSSQNPISVLSGNVRKRMKNPVVRGILVSIQFFISITLVISTVEIYRQLNFVNEIDLGFTKDNIVVVERAYALGNYQSEFIKELKQNSSTIDASICSTLPGKDFNSTSHRMEVGSDDDIHLLHYLTVENNFQSILDIELVEGRFFSSEFPLDYNEIVLNESAVIEMGIDNPLGKNITAFIDSVCRYKIVGIVRDFNFESLYREIHPLAIYQRHPTDYAKYVIIKVRPERLEGIETFIKDTWTDIVPDQTFSCFQFNEELQKLYLDDKETGRIFLVFSLLALFIAVLGLYGLALFITLQRSKEIGIRKVMGATVFSIVFMLLRDFSKWIVLANLVAWPTAYYLINQWNKSFVYKIELNLSVYIFSGLFILLVALLAITIQTLRVAHENPVKALKYE